MDAPINLRIATAGSTRCGARPGTDAKPLAWRDAASLLSHRPSEESSALLTVARVVIDAAGELSAREGHRVEDFMTAVRNLARIDGVTPELVGELARLPGFRNLVVQEYVGLDFEVAVQALDRLEPMERFLEVVIGRIEVGDDG